eukprot:12413364-Alexandrium_andersonii.AAC.1
MVPAPTRQARSGRHSGARVHMHSACGLRLGSLHQCDIRRGAWRLRPCDVGRSARLCDLGRGAAPGRP